MRMVFDLCRSSVPLRAAACRVLRAVASKGMDGNSKAELIDSLGLIDFIVNQFEGMADDDENECVVSLHTSNHLSLSIYLSSSSLFLNGATSSLRMFSYLHTSVNNNVLCHRSHRYSIALASLTCTLGTELVASVRQLADAGEDPSRAATLLDRVFDTAVGVMQSECVVAPSFGVRCVCVCVCVCIIVS